MISVAVGGATGKLGRMVCDMINSSEDMTLTGAIVSPAGKNIGCELYNGVKAKGPDDLENVLENADVYVDLTSPDAASKIIARVPATGTNMIIGTTSIPDDIIKKMSSEVSVNGTSALISSNFAIGVNVFWDMCGKLASLLKGYDTEIIETHHIQKKDSPSGTSREIVKRIMKASGDTRKDICVHSVRAGDVVGDHTVIFAGNKEVIELKHKAVSREAFAMGCLRSIRWIHGKRDGTVHEMSEVLL